MEYFKVKTASAKEVDDLLSLGWVVIDTVKVLVDFPETFTLTYHMGLPLKVQLKNLEAIIKEYEKYGLKEVLFEKVAKEYGEKIDDYDMNGFFSETKELGRFMTSYEKVVDGSPQKYTLKNSGYNFNGGKNNKDINYNSEDIGF